MKKIIFLFTIGVFIFSLPFSGQAKKRYKTYHRPGTLKYGGFEIVSDFNSYFLRPAVGVGWRTKYFEAEGLIDTKASTTVKLKGLYPIDRYSKYSIFVGASNSLEYLQVLEKQNDVEGHYQVKTEVTYNFYPEIGVRIIFDRWAVSPYALYMINDGKIGGGISVSVAIL